MAVNTFLVCLNLSQLSSFFWPCLYKTQCEAEACIVTVVVAVVIGQCGTSIVFENTNTNICIHIGPFLVHQNVFEFIFIKIH